LRTLNIHKCNRRLYPKKRKNQQASSARLECGIPLLITTYTAKSCPTTMPNQHRNVFPHPKSNVAPHSLKTHHSRRHNNTQWKYQKLCLPCNHGVWASHALSLFASNNSNNKCRSCKLYKRLISSNRRTNNKETSNSVLTELMLCHRNMGIMSVARKGSISNKGYRINQNLIIRSRQRRQSCRMSSISHLRAPATWSNSTHKKLNRSTTLSSC